MSLKHIYYLILTPFQRMKWWLFNSVFSKNEIISENNKNIFRKIYKNNYWASQESFSGGGSHIETTINIRNALPVLWEEYDIKTFLDIPCGDYNWMKEVSKKNIVYRGGDIVSEIIDRNNQHYKDINISFNVFDITKDDLPNVDMIFCKDCFQHLSFSNVFKALINFKKSNSKYLLTTSYPLTWVNWDIADGDYRALNLRLRPFNLPKPIYKLHEGSKGYQMEVDKYFYLYKLKEINI
ncbi:glycosyltransferase sugar-binding region DXD domain protein [Treponema primitia ZAS-2]|uniref:Glycosyltransferase sugar-binding region DXD domain protein n=1 Tax=Treponema primitia (strain ATCC BAA-887 / DSM 12427 / ZAS-2) TaxID=545694 RepID=F5YNY2_TREPZ|nr:class I SAM-dependent methyltransferase [Treponema primitia]AEF83699.1 glycosyltransferase sugar-binding region DXD domain protein [Treponema primitia ZAS-2]